MQYAEALAACLEYALLCSKILPGEEILARKMSGGYSATWASHYYTVVFELYSSKLQMRMRAGFAQSSGLPREPDEVLKICQVLNEMATIAEKFNKLFGEVVVDMV